MTKLVPLRRIARLIYGDALPSDIREDGEIPVFGSGGQSGYHVAANTPGPAIIVGRKGSYGSIHWSDKDCFTIDTAYSVLLTGDTTDLRWLYYALQAVGLKGASQDVGVPGLSREVAYDVRIPIVSLSKQRQTADFLDTETAQISRLMASQTRVIELLDERVNSQIKEIIGRSKLVTTGSGKIVPIRRLLQKLKRKTSSSDNVITAFRDGQVTSRNARRTEGYTLAANTGPHGQGVEVGDVVVHGLDGFSGAIGDSEAVGNCSPVYHICTPIDGGNSTFYGRLLRVLAIDGYLGLFATSTRERAVDFRNWELFGNIPVPLVDPVVQHQIGRAIARIRPLREDILQFNKLLDERRRALITAAVIGQIDVTTARELFEVDGVKV